MSSSDLLETAVQAARLAGRELLSAWSDRLEVVYEDEGDIKLEMDRRAEGIIVETIRRRFPGHALLSEECGEIGGKDVQWVIDPLDGTHNYFRRIPCWCVSIGAVIGGDPRVGVIYDPVHERLYTGERGKGVRVNGEPVSVSERQSLSGSVLAFGCYHRDKASVDAWLRRTGWVTPRARSVRNMGAAAMHCAFVASGVVDGFVEYGVRAWDVTAGVALVLEAGGRVSQWAHRDGAIDIVAATPQVHDELLASGLWPLGEKGR